jgi:hypothetical protein
MDEPFFHPMNEIWENLNCSSIHVVESFIYNGYFKSKFGIFLCRRNEMWENNRQKHYTIENHE